MAGCGGCKPGGGARCCWAGAPFMRGAHEAVLSFALTRFLAFLGICHFVEPHPELVAEYGGAVLARIVVHLELGDDRSGRRSERVRFGGAWSDDRRHECSARMGELGRRLESLGRTRDGSGRRRRHGRVRRMQAWRRGALLLLLGGRAVHARWRALRGGRVGGLASGWRALRGALLGRRRGNAVVVVVVRVAACEHAHSDAADTAVPFLVIGMGSSLVLVELHMVRRGPTQSSARLPDALVDCALLVLLWWSQARHPWFVVCQVG
jgi:hypothetical protein